MGQNLHANMEGFCRTSYMVILCFGAFSDTNFVAFYQFLCPLMFGKNDQAED